MLTRGEIAEVLRVHPQTVSRLMREGLPYILVGGSSEVFCGFGVGLGVCAG